MNAAVFSVLSILVISCSGQRSYYAGRSPIGYPSLVPPSTTTTTTNPLGNRFGEDITTPSTTTVRLPIEAQGDRELYNRLLKLPVDKQPFWLLNWQALEANRRTPQTYAQRRNEFVEQNLNFRG